MSLGCLLRVQCTRLVIRGVPSAGAHTHYAPPRYLQKPVPMHRQSRILPGDVRTSQLLDDPSQLISHIPYSPEVTTVYDCLTHGCNVSKNGDCIGTKNPATGEYNWDSYSSVITRSKNVGSALLEMGLLPRKSFVGVFASNRPEFFLTLFACAGYSLVLVPLYETLGLQSVLHIIAQAELSLVIVHNPDYAQRILQNIAKIPSLKTLILMEGLTPQLTKSANEKNLQIMTFVQFEEIGQKHTKDLVLPSPDDLFSVPYTSGTTGVPKGVMLTHKNIITCVASLVIGYGEAGSFGGTIVSYLPPAHIYEICNQVASMYFARRMAFFRDDIRHLMTEVRRIQPTILPLVPRLMNAIYIKEMENFKGRPLKSLLLKIALAQKEKLMKKGNVTCDSIWDKLVFRNFRETLGGNVHIVTSTSAPVPPDIMHFYRLAAGCYLFEVYGATEVLAGTMTLPWEYKGGSVGAPLPCNYMKLVDVPEMGYLAKDGVGEVCFKGPNVFQGYYKNEKATEESIIDGWQHTGDVGRWLPNGTLQIIDRKKHLFKLSQGEYIAPEKVQNVYSHSDVVLQVFVDGLSDKNYTVMLVVPEMNHLKTWLKSKGFKGEENLEELLRRKEVRTAFLVELHEYGKKEDLNPLEQARNVRFILEPFTVANDLMTPTMKIRRNEARKVFEPLFLEMYAEGSLVSSLK